MKFIIGIGRSGTSLIQSFLSAQVGACVLPENQLIRRLIIANSTNRLYTHREFDLLFKKNNPRYKNLKPYLDKLDIEYPISGFELIQIFDQKFDGIIEKDARNIDYIYQINKILKCHYLLCIRDIRDVLLSRRKVKFSKKWTLILDMFICKIQIFGYFKYRNQSDICIQKYEDFLDSKFSGITQFLSTDKIDSNVDYEKVAKNLFSEEELSNHKSKNRNRVITTNKQNWKNAGPYFIWMADAFFYDYNMEFGYESMNKSFVVISVNKMINFITSFLYPFYIMVSKFRDRRFYKI